MCASRSPPSRSVESLSGAKLCRNAPKPTSGPVADGPASSSTRATASGCWKCSSTVMMRNGLSRFDGRLTARSNRPALSSYAGNLAVKPDTASGYCLCRDKCAWRASHVRSRAHCQCHRTAELAWARRSLSAGASQAGRQSLTITHRIAAHWHASCIRRPDRVRATSRQSVLQVVTESLDCDDEIGADFGCRRHRTGAQRLASVWPSRLDTACGPLTPILVCASPETPTPTVGYASMTSL
jgi:hypothetical protein